MISKDEAEQNAWIKSLLNDASHDSNPLKKALALIYQREQLASAKLKHLLESFSNEEDVNRLLTDYEKQVKRLEKISRISDLYQQGMRGLNEELKRQTALAEKANRAKSNFLSRVSHDLRSPLNGILGFAKLLQYKSNTPALQNNQARYIENIIVSGHHLLQLINELLDLAAIEAGKLAVQPEAVLLKTVVAECFVIVAPLTRNKNITLVDKISEPEITSCYVYADPLRLKQILINLISNAIKYNRPDGQVQVSIYQPEFKCWRIQIEDTGYGLTDEKMAQLFQAFNRLGVSGDTEGCGIGLVIAKSLVELMGGKMGVSSQEGLGSTFWFELPTTTQVTPA